MNYQEVLAYIVIGLFITFGFIPFVGSSFNGKFSTYKEDFLVGIAMSGVFLAILSATAVLAWSINIVLKIN